MSAFILHDRLAADTVPVCDLTLCRVLLMNNRIWPWVILVPRRADLREIHHLPDLDRQQLMAEITAVSTVIERDFAPDKLNVGALGNMVAQLHIHIVGRKIGDPAWPGPVWGSGHADPYAEQDRASLAAQLRAALA